MIREYDRCPQCRGPVTQESLCPGYLDKDRWMQCYPACGKASLYECPQVACGWWFIDGMNRRNPLFHDNEQRRPTWLALSELELSEREERRYGATCR